MDDNEWRQLKLARKYLKLRIMEDNVTFRGHAQERMHLHYLLTKTIESGESHSAVIVGPKGSGKTTLVNSVLGELSQRPHFEDDVILVKLCGLLHGDDKVALNSITTQMGLDNAVGDRVFGSFAENFTYLLNCLQSGESRSCKSVVFVMDEFHLFCHTNASQTLLYNLFDVSHNQIAPICVIGITCRLNFMDLLEKRIKSRFSQRHIFIFPNEVDDSAKMEETPVRTPIEKRLTLFTQLLSLPAKFTKAQSVKTPKASTKRRKDLKKKVGKGYDISELLDEVHMNEDEQNGDSDIQLIVPQAILERCNVASDEFASLDPVFISLWNEHVKCLSSDRSVIEALQRQYFYNISERSLRDTLFRVMCLITLKHPQIEPSDIQLMVSRAIDENGSVVLIQSLSVLELSLLIAMKHQTEIFDGQPMNFEMVLNRYTKFANSNSSSQSVPRPVILKAFEHLRDLAIIGPYKGSALGKSSSNHSRVQKEYQLYILLVTEDEINEGIRGYKNLPTEICQWVLNSVA